MKLVFVTVVLYIAKTQPQNPKDNMIPPISPGKPDSQNDLKIFFLQDITKKVKTVREKNKDLQNNICHKEAPSKDFTISPPKLKLRAPKKTRKGPGNFVIFSILNFKLSVYQYC